VISKCYGIPEEQLQNFNISYTDEEDDKVLITSEFDFDQAMVFMSNQNLNILRINIDIAEKLVEEIKSIKPENNTFELIDERKKFDKDTRSIFTESDVNDKTLNFSTKSTERNTNKLTEICNKIENMTILENINDKKENIKNEILINNEIDKFNKVLDKFKNNEIKELIIKGKEKRKDRKHSKEKKKKESKKDDKKDYEELIKTYENKFKSTFEKVLSKNLEKCKQKLMEKAMGKTKKLLRN